MHRLFIICLSVCCASRSRKCRAYGDDTFAGGGLQSLARTLYTSPLIKEGSLSELCYVFLFVWWFFFRFWCLTWRETIRSSTICVGVNAQHGEQGKRFYSKLWIACMERGNTIATPIIKISQYKCSLFSNNFALLPRHHRFCVWAQIRLFKMTC